MPFQTEISILNLSCAKQVGNLMQLLFVVQSQILKKKSGRGGNQAFHSKYPEAVNSVISRLT